MPPVKSYPFTSTDMQQPEVQSAVNYQFAFYTHRSPLSESGNQDSLAVIELDDSSMILAVADGLGGQPAGASASATAIETLCEHAKTSEQSSLREKILDSFEQANRRIIETAVGSATTLSIVSLENTTLRPFHVGDSTILLCGQRGRIKLQTTSHSPVGYAVESGILDESEAILHEERHYILNTVGSAEMHIEIGPELLMSQYDTLLLASDGLFDNLYIEEIVEIIRKGPLLAAIQTLAEKSRQRMLEQEGQSPSHPDDLSIILCRRNA